MSAPSLQFNMILDILASAIREEKEIKETQTRKKEVKLSLFEDDILCIQKPKDSANPMRTNIFSEVEKYKNKHTKISCTYTLKLTIRKRN